MMIRRSRSNTCRTTSGNPQEQILSDMLLHLFNHQAHHRGRAHARLSILTKQEPPPLGFAYVPAQPPCTEPLRALTSMAGFTRGKSFERSGIFRASSTEADSKGDPGGMERCHAFAPIYHSSSSVSGYRPDICGRGEWRLISYLQNSLSRRFWPPVH